MKTLYVSDLDGTLFTTQKSLTGRTVMLLNECIDRGALFAVATARMPYGCDYRLEPLRLNIPSVLTNGVFLYNFETREYLATETIAAPAARQVVGAFAAHDVGVFLYTFANNEISIYYDRPELTGQTQYYSKRALENCRTVEYQPRLESLAGDGNVCYLACTGPREELEPVLHAIEQIPGVSCAFYLNIYNGLYCIEVFAQTASKKNALLKLKALLDCSEIVVFGDNLNDLSMFEIADRGYAVENALEEVKQKATGVLPGCDEDGVAIFMHREICGK